MSVGDLNRLDRPHLHASCERNLECNNLTHGFKDTTARGKYVYDVTTVPSRIPPPPGEDEIPIHSRSYTVNVFRVDEGHMRLRGRVIDTKPAGLYVRNDDDPLDVHDMVVDLIVSFPFLEIQSVTVILDTHPNLLCPSIEPLFQQLAGVSIARGFSRTLTDLFGGPKGCTHVVSLLRAMAPVAVQAIYSMEAADPDRDPAKAWNTRERSEEQRLGALSFIEDTCHVWASGGERLQRAKAGELVEAPIWIRERLTKLGREDELRHWE